MIQFFKINDPLKIAFILLFAIIIRLIALIWFIPVLVPEFQWMLLGEKLSEGLLLYSDVEDHTAVLSGAVYWFIHELFGRSHIAHQIIALFLVTGQAIAFNFIINKNDLLKDQTFVPGLIYIILSSLYVDFYIVSPALLGLTFALFAFSRLFQILKSGNSDDLAFKLGLNLGIAFLFYKPFILLLLLILFDLLLYSNTRFKRYIIVAFSFLFPTLLMISFYYWKHSLDDFMSLFLINSFSIESIKFLGLSDIIVLLSIPLTISIMGVFGMIQGIGYINYQIKCHYVLLHWLILGTLGAFFATEFSLLSFIPVLPVLVIFSSAYFMDFKRKWLSEVLFICFITFCLTMLYSHKNDSWKNNGLINNENLVLKKHELPADGKLLVLSDQVQYYSNNKIATSFINWRINKEYFEDLDDYNNISYIYEKMNQDLPDVIIDPENYCFKLFTFLPSIEKQYSRTGIMYFKKD